MPDNTQRNTNPMRTPPLIGHPRSIPLQAHPRARTAHPTPGITAMNRNATHTRPINAPPNENGTLITQFSTMRINENGPVPVNMRPIERPQTGTPTRYGYLAGLAKQTHHTRRTEPPIPQPREDATQENP